MDSLAPKTFIYLFNPVQWNDDKPPPAHANYKVMEQVDFSILNLVLVDWVIGRILLFQQCCFTLRQTVYIYPGLCEETCDRNDQVQNDDEQASFGRCVYHVSF